jgi:hypothetical protein
MRGDSDDVGVSGIRPGITRGRFKDFKVVPNGILYAEREFFLSFPYFAARTFLGRSSFC